MTFLWVSSRSSPLISHPKYCRPVRRICPLPSMLSFLCYLGLMQQCSAFLITWLPQDAGRVTGRVRRPASMASVAPLTTMSGFTLAVNCPPPLLVAGSSPVFSSLFVFLLIGSDLNRLTVGWDFSATCSLTPLIRCSYMAVYIRQTFAQAMGDASFYLETYTRARACTHTLSHTHPRWRNGRVCSFVLVSRLCVLCVCPNHCMDLDNWADNEF